VAIHHFSSILACCLPQMSHVKRSIQAIECFVILSLKVSPCFVTGEVILAARAPNERVQNYIKKVESDLHTKSASVVPE
jgi:hypothetical protein